MQVKGTETDLWNGNSPRVGGGDSDDIVSTDLRAPGGEEYMVRINGSGCRLPLGVEPRPLSFATSRKESRQQDWSTAT